VGEDWGKTGGQAKQHDEKTITGKGRGRKTIPGRENVKTARERGGKVSDGHKKKNRIRQRPKKGGVRCRETAAKGKFMTRKIEESEGVRSRCGTLIEQIAVTSGLSD